MSLAQRLSVFVLLVLAAGCDHRVPTQPSDPGASPLGVQRSTGPIAFVSDRDGIEQIYLANADGSAVTRLTPGAAPAWSRDGQRLVFFSAQDQEIYVINVDGSGRSPVTHGWDPDWSPDGRTVVFRGPSFGIDVVDVSGSNFRALYNTVYGAFDPAWSPDGRRIAFSAGTYIDEGLGLWVVNPDGSDAHHIGPDDGELPAWSPDSSEIAFVTPSGSIGVSSADGSGQGVRAAGPATSVDWTPDGKLVFTRSASPNRKAPGQRIFIAADGDERQLIPEASAPVRPDYSDREIAWRR
jgi:Tol biopolymer transport system component